ncbi:hypothetical protein DUNSADRAFT_17763 [Dunaliella salina]|uniref:Uncharacterized protein n=1 Tax=Dunaliella salina TaxID=3046 RepID=A0ABQ7G151_DUNSA|nr:hypothetical protein DUNSADRAFT_17763 [Dunaliella salina]|eukprot:KAF5828340.1 hypothetical protein DUNSADRAFT_17763 [Dunaliella salina]
MAMKYRLFLCCIFCAADDGTCKPVAKGATQGLELLGADVGQGVHVDAFSIMMENVCTRTQRVMVIHFIHP